MSILVETELVEFFRSKYNKKKIFQQEKADSNSRKTQSRESTVTALSTAETPAKSWGTGTPWFRSVLRVVWVSALYEMCSLFFFFYLLVTGTEIKQEMN